MDSQPQSFALETYVRRSFNQLTRMVDGEGLPYFNVFWKEPAEAAHDWLGFGDTVKGGNYKGFFRVPRSVLMGIQRIEGMQRGT